MRSTAGIYALYSESNDKETEVLKLNFIHKREAYPSPLHHHPFAPSPTTQVLAQPPSHKCLVTSLVLKTFGQYMMSGNAFTETICMTRYQLQFYIVDCHLFFCCMTKVGGMFHIAQFHTKF